MSKIFINYIKNQVSLLKMLSIKFSNEINKIIDNQNLTFNHLSWTQNKERSSNVPPKKILKKMETREPLIL